MCSTHFLALFPQRYRYEGGVVGRVPLRGLEREFVVYWMVYVDPSIFLSRFTPASLDMVKLSPYVLVFSSFPNGT